MARKNEESPLSLFSFQDIIMSVSGIIMLVVLLLALNIVTSPMKGGGGDTMPPGEYQKKEIELKELRNTIQHNEAAIAALADEVQAHVEQQRKSRNSPSTKGLRTVIAALRGKIRLLERDTAEKHQDIERDNQEKREMEEENVEMRAAIQELKKNTDATKRIHLIPDQATDKTIFIATCSGSTLVFYKYGASDRRQQFFTTQAGVNQFVNHAKQVVRGNSCLVVMIRPSASDFAPGLIDMLRKAGVPFGHEPLAENWVVENEDG